METFESLFGLTTSNPDEWLKDKGSALGREVMGKMMQSVYADSGLQLPSDAIGAQFWSACLQAVLVRHCHILASPAWPLAAGSERSIDDEPCEIYRSSLSKCSAMTPRIISLLWPWPCSSPNGFSIIQTSPICWEGPVGRTGLQLHNLHVQCRGR